MRSRALLIMVFVAGVGLATILAVAPDVLSPVDEPVSEAARGGAAGFWRGVSRLGSTATGVVVSGTLAIALWPRCRSFAVVYPAAFLAAVVADVTLKVVVDRPRPPLPNTGTALGSFPSGHVLRAVVVFGLIPPALYVLNHTWRVFWSSVAMATGAALMTAASRVALGAHWPSDVAASLLLGAFMLLAAELALGSSPALARCGRCAFHRTAPEWTRPEQPPGHGRKVRSRSRTRRRVRRG